MVTIENNRYSPKQAIIILGKEIWGFITKYVWQYLFLVVNAFLGFFIREQNLGNLTWIQILAMLVIPVPLTYLFFRTKAHEEKKIRSELDLQYAISFTLTGKSIFDLGGVIRGSTKQKLPYTRYLENILTNVSLSVESILKENDIPVGTICTNLMIFKNDQLIKVAYGPVLANRPPSPLQVTTINPRPGAPSAFVTKQIVYVKNTTSGKMRRFFTSTEYKSFFSIPVPVDEDKDNVFAVLNVDSDQVNQFMSIKFVESKIYKSLLPTMALIKILHTIGKI